MRGRHKAKGPTLPAEPFQRWLKDTFPTAMQASIETHIREDTIRKIWLGHTRTVNLDVVDRALLDQWETIDDLYPLEVAA